MKTRIQKSSRYSPMHPWVVIRGVEHYYFPTWQAAAIYAIFGVKLWR